MPIDDDKVKQLKVIIKQHKTDAQKYYDDHADIIELCYNIIHQQRQDYRKKKEYQVVHEKKWNELDQGELTEYLQLFLNAILTFVIELFLEVLCQCKLKSQNKGQDMQQLLQEALQKC